MFTLFEKHRTGRTAVFVSSFNLSFGLSCGTGLATQEHWYLWVYITVGVVFLQSTAGSLYFAAFILPSIIESRKGPLYRNKPMLLQGGLLWVTFSDSANFTTFINSSAFAIILYPLPSFYFVTDFVRIDLYLHKCFLGQEIAKPAAGPSDTYCKIICHTLITHRWFSFRLCA